MKEKTKPFSSRINPQIGKAVKDYCLREGIKIQRFLEEALLKELAKKRNGEK